MDLHYTLEGYYVVSSLFDYSIPNSTVLEKSISIVVDFGGISFSDGNQKERIGWSLIVSVNKMQLPSSKVDETEEPIKQRLLCIDTVDFRHIGLRVELPDDTWRQLVEDIDARMVLEDKREMPMEILDDEGSSNGRSLQHLFTDELVRQGASIDVWKQFLPLEENSKWKELFSRTLSPVYVWGWNDGSLTGALLLRSGRPKTSLLKAAYKENLRWYSAFYSTEQCFEDVLQHGQNLPNEKKNIFVDMGVRSIAANVDVDSFYLEWGKVLYGDFSILHIISIFEDLHEVASVNFMSWESFFENSSVLAWKDVCIKCLTLASKLKKHLRKGRTVMLLRGSSSTGEIDSIIAVLIELMVDPYYRTIEGFLLLVYKEVLVYPDLVVQRSYWVILYLFFSCVVELVLENSEKFEFMPSMIEELLVDFYKFGIVKAYYATNQGQNNNLIPIYKKVMSKFTKEDQHRNPDFIPVPENSESRYLEFSSNTMKPIWEFFILKNNAYSISVNELKTSLLLKPSGLTELTLSEARLSLPRLSFKTEASEEESSNDLEDTPDPISRKLGEKFSAVENLVINEGHLFSLDASWLKLPLANLTINNNPIGFLPHSITKLKTLRHLQLNMIGLEILNMFQSGGLLLLETLNLSNNSLKDVSQISQFSSLTELFLDHNQLEDIPIELNRLTNLTCLSLSHNSIGRISHSFLSKLVYLRMLNVSYNKIHYLPNSFDTLTEILELHLEHNRLNSLPPTLCNNVSLEYLCLDNNLFSMIHSGIRGCLSLKYLSIRNNSLVELQDSLSNCELLEEINVSGNRLTNIPPWLMWLNYISVLDCSYNNLTKVSSCLGVIRSLKVLSIANNNITTLPPILANILPNLEKFSIERNENIEKELAGLDKDQLTDVLQERFNELSLKVSSKIMIVGNHSTGKTSLLRAINKKFGVDESDTKTKSSGLSITNTIFSKFFGKYRPSTSFASKLKKKRIKDSISGSGLQVWDFGGPSVFVDKFEKEIDFWINSITVHVSSPSIVVVGTHLDQCHPRQAQSAISRISKIKEKYGDLGITFFTVSTTSNSDDLSELRTVLFETVSELISKEKTMKKEHFMMETLLMDLRNHLGSIPVLTYHEFIKLACKCGIEGKNEVLRCARILHKKGSIVHFQKSITQGQIICLDASWFFSILNTVYSAHKTRVGYGGVISHSQLLVILNQQTTEVGEKILLMMVLLGIAVPVTLPSTRSIPLANIPILPKKENNEEKLYFVPGYLSHHPPKNSGTSSAEKYVENEFSREFSFSYMPAGFVSRLISLLMTRFCTSVLSVWCDGITGELIRTHEERLYYDDGGVTISSSKLNVWVNVAAGGFEELNMKSSVNRGKSIDADSDGEDEESFLVSSNSPQEKGRYIMKGVSNRQSGPSPQKRQHLSARSAKRLTIGPLNISRNTSRNEENKPKTLDKSVFKPLNKLLVQVRCEVKEVASESFIRLLELFEVVALEFSGIEMTRFARRKREDGAIIEIGDNDRNKYPGSSNQQESRINVNEVHDLILAGVEIKNIIALTKVEEDVVPDLFFTNYKGPRLNHGDITNLRELARNEQSVVRVGELYGEDVATKEILFPQKESRFIVHLNFERELTIQSSMKSPYFVKTRGLCLSPLTMVMEYCSKGNLFNLLHVKKTPLSNLMKVKFSYDLAQGLNYLQSRSPPIALLDFKSPNILISTLEPPSSDNWTPEGIIHCKICDFGLARRVTQPFYDRVVDNPIWLAPEALGFLSYNEKVDTYAYGVVCWEILTGKEFFGEYKFFAEIADKIVSGERPTFDGYFNDRFVELIEKCWDQDPWDRPPITEVLPVLELCREDAVIQKPWVYSSRSVVNLKSSMSSRHGPTMSYRTLPLLKISETGGEEINYAHATLPSPVGSKKELKIKRDFKLSQKQKRLSAQLQVDTDKHGFLFSKSTPRSSSRPSSGQYSFPVVMDFSDSPTHTSAEEETKDSAVSVSDEGERDNEIVEETESKLTNSEEEVRPAETDNNTSFLKCTRNEGQYRLRLPPSRSNTDPGSENNNRSSNCLSSSSSASKQRRSRRTKRSASFSNHESFVKEFKKSVVSENFPLAKFTRQYSPGVTQSSTQWLSSSPSDRMAPHKTFSSDHLTMGAGSQRTPQPAVSSSKEPEYELELEPETVKGMVRSLSTPSRRTFLQKARKSENHKQRGIVHQSDSSPNKGENESVQIDENDRIERARSLSKKSVQSHRKKSETSPLVSKSVDFKRSHSQTEVIPRHRFSADDGEDLYHYNAKEKQSSQENISHLTKNLDFVKNKRPLRKASRTRSLSRSGTELVSKLDFRKLKKKSNIVDKDHK